MTEEKNTRVNPENKENRDEINPEAEDASKTKKVKKSRAGHYGPGFAGNPWRDKVGRFTNESRDADGKPYT